MTNTNIVMIALVYGSGLLRWRSAERALETKT